MRTGAPIAPAGTLSGNASDLVLHEARCLDRREWDAWIDLYTADAVFWMPAWKSEDELTEDPATELSLIHYAGRKRLEERVWRVRSRQSAASVPLRRTVHCVTNVLVERAEGNAARVASNFTVHAFDPRSKAEHSFFGFYQHDLRREGDAWKIAAKKTVLVNDYIPGVLDFYMI